MSRAITTAAFAILAASALSGTDGVPAWIKVIPAGTFTLRDGRGPFDSGDRASMQLIIERSLAAAGNTDIMMDYDHQSVFAVNDRVGGTAVAAGWIKKLEARDDGIWAQVEWTDVAAAKIKAREYRYISPFFTFDKKTGDVGLIGSAALVNNPAIDFEAIAASYTSPKPEDTMKGIAKLLGLAETATEAEIVGAITASREAIAVAMGTNKESTFAQLATAAGAILAGTGKVAASLGLKVDATVDQVTAAISTLGKGTGDFVPKASFDALSTRFETLQTSIATAAVTAEVEGAIAAGKVAPAQEEWATAYASRDLKGFQDFVKSAPVLTGAQLGDAAQRDASAGAMNPQEVATAAIAYQTEQQNLGRVVSTVDAVAHIEKKNKVGGK